MPHNFPSRPRTFPSCPAPSRHSSRLPGMPRCRRLSLRGVRASLRSSLWAGPAQTGVFLPLLQEKGLCVVTRLLQGKISTQALNTWKISLTSSHRISCDGPSPEKPRPQGLPTREQALFSKLNHLQVRQSRENTCSGSNSFSFFCTDPQLYPVWAIIHCLIALFPSNSN